MDRMTTVHSQISALLKKINDKRSELSLKKSRQFAVGEWVLVDRRNLTVKAGNNRSLTHKWIGPYQVIKVLGCHAYKLDLPKGICIHNVVHTILLKLFNKYDGDDEMQINDEADELFFEVEKILDSKRFGKIVKYRIRWKGYTEADDTWQPITSLQSVMDMVRAFHKANPKAPRDRTLEN